MTLQFSFAPAVFVGNPGHQESAHDTIVQADARAVHLAMGGYYLPECVRSAHWKQSHVYFGYMSPAGLIQVKVFSNN